MNILDQWFEHPTQLHVLKIKAHDVVQLVAGKTVAQARRLAERIAKSDTLPPRVRVVK